MKKYLLALLAALGLTCLGFAEDTVTVNWLDKITVDDLTWYTDATAGVGSSPLKPYLITTPEQLTGLAYICGTATDTFHGKYIKLGADIDLAGANWSVPIGLDGATFKGTFDGDGHTIRNLKIETTSGIQGLFGFTYLATVQNLTIENANVTAAYYHGALVGYAESTLIENCHLKGTVTIKAPYNYGYAGGFVGYSYGTTIRNCTASGILTVTSPNSYLGGFVGYAEDVSVTGCSTDASSTLTVKADLDSTSQAAYVGGIIGLLGGSSSTSDKASINNCTLRGTVNVSAPNNNYAGGMVGGCFYMTDITNLTVDANLTVNAGWNVGGLIGCLWSVDIDEISDCSVTGDIDISATVANTEKRTSTAAGLFGTGQNSTKVKVLKNCHLSGKFRIVSEGDQVAGIISSGPIKQIIGCTVKGTNLDDEGTQSYIRAEGGSQAAGIIAYHATGDYNYLVATTTGCVVENVKISAAKWTVGGISGFTRPGVTIQDCMLINVKLECDNSEKKAAGLFAGSHIGNYETYPVKVYNCTYDENTTLTFPNLGETSDRLIAAYDWHYNLKEDGQFAGTDVTFEDGKVTGGTFEIFDETIAANTILAEGAKWDVDEETGLYKVTAPVATVAGIKEEFLSLQAAINAALAEGFPGDENGKYIVTLLRNVTEDVKIAIVQQQSKMRMMTLAAADEETETPTTKTLTLNLNGKNINSTVTVPVTANLKLDSAVTTTDETTGETTTTQVDGSVQQIVVEKEGKVAPEVTKTEKVTANTIPAGTEWTDQKDESGVDTKIDLLSVPSFKLILGSHQPDAFETLTAQPAGAEKPMTAEELATWYEVAPSENVVMATETVALVVVPKADYTFYGWSGDFVSAQADASAPVQGNTEADPKTMTVVANFIPTTLYTAMTNQVVQATLETSEQMAYSDLQTISQTTPVIAVPADAAAGELTLQVMKATTLQAEETGKPDWSAVKGSDAKDHGFDTDDAFKVVLPIPADETKAFFKVVVPDSELPDQDAQ